MAFASGTLFYWWHIIILQGTCTCQWHMLEIRSLNREGKAPGKFLFSLKVIMTVKLVVKLSGSLGYQQAATTYYNNLQVHHFQHRFYQQKIKSRKQETGVSIHDKDIQQEFKIQHNGFPLLQVYIHCTKRKQVPDQTITFTAITPIIPAF